MYRRRSEHQVGANFFPLVWSRLPGSKWFRNVQEVFPTSQVAKYWQRQECSQSSLFQWNCGMLTGRVSMPIAARTSALTTVNFCAVSHMWESMQHPDPWGFQLAQIAEKYSKHIGNGLTWVFLDYVSLFQFRRTAEEDDWFYRALDGMHILYAHEAIEVTILVDLTPEHLKSAREVWAFSEAEDLVILMSIAMLRLNATPHHLRGWCQAEKQWALLRGLLLAGCVPLCPDAFKQLMQEMRFTHRNLGIEKLNPGENWKHWSSPSWGRFILQEIWYQFFSKFLWATKFHQISTLIWHQERCARGLQAPGESLQVEDFHHNPASTGEAWPCGARQPAGGFASLHQAYGHRGEWNPTFEPRRNSIYSNLATSCVCLCCRGWDGLGVSVPIFRFLDGFAVQSGSANNGYYVR